jgi:hypothetical protein
MSDNTVITAQTGGDTIRDLARQSGSVKTQVMQLDLGGVTGNAELLVTAGQQTMANSMPVAIASNQAAVPVTGNKPVGPATIAVAQVTIGTSAAQIVAARTGAVGTGRCSVTLNNTGAATIFVGPSGVTTTTGFPIAAGEIFSFDTTAAMFGISTAVGNVVGVLETF